MCFEVVNMADAMASRCHSALSECRHFVCNECLFGHVRIRVMDEGDLSLLVCPAEMCRKRIHSVAVETILESDEEALSRYRMLQVLSFLVTILSLLVTILSLLVTILSLLVTMADSLAVPNAPGVSHGDQERQYP